MKHLLLSHLLLTATTPPAFAQTSTVATHLVSCGQHCPLIARGTLRLRLNYGQQAAKYTGSTAAPAQADQANTRDLFFVAAARNYFSGSARELAGARPRAGDIGYPDTTPRVRAGTIIGTFRTGVQYLLRRREHA